MGDAMEEDSLANQIKELEDETGRKREEILEGCYPFYDDAFSSWIHIKAIRSFVEGVLRYGVPPKNSSIIIEPKSSKDVRNIEKILEKICPDEKGLSSMDVDENVKRMLASDTASK